MHHEHHGDCCQPEAAYLHEYHEHHHAALPLGHICTGACMHEAAEVEAMALLHEQQAFIDQLQSSTMHKEEAKRKEKNAKHKKRSKNLGMLGLVPSTPFKSEAQPI